jgi:hypothetical protein
MSGILKEADLRVFAGWTTKKRVFATALHP